MIFLPTASESGPSVGVDLSLLSESGPSVATDVSSAAGFGDGGGISASFGLQMAICD